MTKTTKTSKLPRGNATLNTTGTKTTQREAIALLEAKGFRLTAALVLTGSWDPKVGGSGLQAIVDPDGSIITVTHGEFYTATKSADVGVELYANGNGLCAELEAQAKFNRGGDADTVAGDAQVKPQSKKARRATEPKLLQPGSGRRLRRRARPRRHQGVARWTPPRAQFRGARSMCSPTQTGPSGPSRRTQ